MLQKPERNVEALLKVAEVVENLPDHEGAVDAISPYPVMLDQITHFSMRKVYGKIECGTAACIAGVISLMFPTQLPADALGLKQGQEIQLFCPKGYQSDQFTSKQAARVLRHLAITGEVDWDV